MMREEINPIIDALSKPEFQIPVHFSDKFKTAYIIHLKDNFEKIIQLLERCEAKDYIPAIKSDVIKKIVFFQKSLLKVIEEYLNGHPSIAYQIFSKILGESGIEKELETIQQISIPSNTTFFRIQKIRKKEDIPVKLSGQKGFLGFKKPLDLFHPPFERRRSVSTNRFSISGYPSLYLSHTLETSYSECFPNRKFGPFNAIAFRNIRPLYFIDLSETKLKFSETLFEGILPNFSTEETHDVIGALEALGIYQMIIATHTKVKYQPFFKDEIFFFKAEYIIPQLFLQWVKVKGLAIDGIRYKSCTASERFPEATHHYNYVLPVKNTLEKGFCYSLKSLFRTSKVYNNFVFEKPKNTRILLKEIAKTIEDEEFKVMK